MTGPDTEVETRLFSLLGSGAKTSRDIQSALGVSQPTASRVVASLSSRVRRLGRGRSTLYALPREVRGCGSDFPVFRVDENGDYERLGVLAALRGGQYWWEPAGGGELFGHLPWFISGMRPEGFMGRAFAGRVGRELGLPERLNDWNDDHVLCALSRRGEDMMGNLIVGEEALSRYLLAARRPHEATSAQDRAGQYQHLVAAAVAGDPPGSSAAGEQPKFTAAILRGELIRNVLVKFSPPVESRTGRRWADLLVCEHLALEVVRGRGIDAARSELVEVGGRYLLEVERFDRAGRLGRLPMVSLLAVDAEFFGMLDNWQSAASRLEGTGMLSGRDAENLRWLYVFGVLIANTDQHFGNVSLIEGGKRGRFSLAPAYDVVPMLYKPVGEELPERAFPPTVPPGARASAHWRSALQSAMEFWVAASADRRISKNFRAVCAENHSILSNLGDGPAIV